MRFVQRFLTFTPDAVGVVQLFMLSRQTGIILSSVVIARGLTLVEVGVFEMLVLCGYLVTFFWSDALLKGYLAQTENNQDKPAPAALIWLYLLTGVVVMSILVIGQNVFLPLLIRRSSLDGLLLFALYQVLIIPVWIAPFLGLLRGSGALMFCGFVFVGPSIACWTGMSISPGVSGALIGLLCYACVGFFWVIASARFVIDFRLKPLLVSLWPATWPLMMYAISAGIARSFDAWLVARYFDESSFAIFRYGAREFPLVIALAAGLSTMMIARLKTSQALDELKLRSTKLMHLCYPVVILIMLFSPVLFTLFFGNAFKESALIFNIYLLITLTQLVFPQSILTARGDTKSLWYISLAELAVNVVASLVLLSWYGLIGIAFGTLIAFVFEKVVLFVFVHRRYGIHVFDIFNIKILSGYTFAIVVTFMMSIWIFGI